jgi:hypothetical protein
VDGGDPGRVEQIQRHVLVGVQDGAVGCTGADQPCAVREQVERPARWIDGDAGDRVQQRDGEVAAAAVHLHHLVHGALVALQRGHRGGLADR